MKHDSTDNFYNLRNAYDVDLSIIPEMVDAALAHFFTKQLWKPMSLTIRIVPEIQNRRNVTLIMGDMKSMHVEENKYLQPCICKRQLEEEIQKLRIHMAFNEIRKRWHEVYSDGTNTEWPYRHDQSMHLYMPRTNSSTSTAKPVFTSIRKRSASFSRDSDQRLKHLLIVDLEKSYSKLIIELAKLQSIFTLKCLPKEGSLKENVQLQFYLILNFVTSALKCYQC
ncbi:Large envelope protein [Dirofilaria immitis]